MNPTVRWTAIIFFGVFALMVLWSGLLETPGILRTVAVVALILGSAALYFLPTIIADRRGHPNRLAICALNILLGWTFVGWAGAIVWSLTSIRKSE